ncbi:hypothetical protein K525DRAFT_182119, partial [Schizophyllum commune Loenen D]
WADSTSKKNDRAVQHFLRFCEVEGVPTAHRLPASEATLCRYASTAAGVLGASAARSRLNAVRAWHIGNLVPWAGGIALQHVLRGVKNMAPVTSRLKKRPPVTKKMLELLASDLNWRSDPIDAATLYVATASFYGQLRLGEILPPAKDINRFRADRLPSACDVETINNIGSHIIHLPWTKTKGVDGEDVAICRQHGPTDPIQAFR